MTGWRRLRRVAAVVLMVGLLGGSLVGLGGCSSRCSMFGDDPWPLCGI